MSNAAVRERAAAMGVRLWQLADALGHDDAWLSRKLRKELPEAEQARLVEIIDSLAEKREKGVNL